MLGSHWRIQWQIRHAFEELALESEKQTLKDWWKCIMVRKQRREKGRQGRPPWRCDIKRNVNNEGKFNRWRSQRRTLRAVMAWPLSLGRNTHTHKPEKWWETVIEPSFQPSRTLLPCWRRAVRRQCVCCPAKVGLWQLEGIPCGCPAGYPPGVREKPSQLLLFRGSSRLFWAGRSPRWWLPDQGSSLSANAF